MIIYRTVRTPPHPTGAVINLVRHQCMYAGIDLWMVVGALGNTKQLFHFSDKADYREIWPDEDRCFWAGKRRFYIAPFAGNVDLAD